MNKFNSGDLVELTYNYKMLALVLSYSHEVEVTDAFPGGGTTKIYKVYVFDKKLTSLYKEWAMRKIS